MPPNGIEEEIVRLLEKRPEGLKISDIARSLGIQRQTISKYVYGLKLAGVVEYREVGRSKVYFLKKGERKKFKFALLIALFLSLNFPIAFAQTQYSLSEITPIDVNLDLYFILSLFLIFLLYSIAAKLSKLSRKISLLITLVLFGVSIYLLLTYKPKIVLNLESFVTGLLTGFVVYVFGKLIILVKKQLINVWGLFFEGVVVAPIVEELLFRFGVITVLFKTSLFGIFTSVVLWSLAHYLGEYLTKLTKYHRSIYGISHTLFSGSLFAIIYVVTDFNLFTSIFAHSFYNFLIWIFAVAPQLNISTSLHSVLKVAPLISSTNLFSMLSPKLRININTFKVLVLSSAIIFSILIFPVAFAQTQSHPLSEITPIDVNLDMFLKNITNVSYAGILALPLITAFRRKRKLTFDIDVASVHVWMEKDARKKEAKDFFDFLRLKEREFELIASKHTLDQIATWKNKTIVSKLISLFKDFCKTVDPDKIIRNFEKKRGIKIKEFSENFAKEARIKTEDALAVIVYSLLGAEYFVTFNKKHLRNKYAKLKEVGWKFGIEIPEIMLPHEFVSLFSKLSEQSSRSFSSKHDSKLNRILFSSFKPSFHTFRLTSSIFKTLLSAIITLTLFSSLTFAQTQSHPLSEITPIDVNLDMFLKNITNVSYVGIGLVNPLYALDVSGSGRISTNLIIGSWLNSTYLNVSSGLIVTPSGNVGIGTTAPQAKLTIQQAESTVLTDFTQAISKAGILIQTNYTADAYTPGVFWVTANNNPTKPKAGLWMSEHGVGTKLYLGTSNNYATGITNQAVTIDQNGNVGIGTTAPENAEGWSRVLDIFGGSTTKLSIRTPNIDARVLAHDAGWWGAPAGMIIGTKTAHPLSFGTNAVSRLTIDSSGNVGIGTTAPSEKLDVVGETKSSQGFYLNKKAITLTTAPKWLRFAQSVSNGGNNAGIFEIRWSRAGVHGHIIFNAGANYNDPNGINLNLLGGSSYGSQGITQIRLLRNTTYDIMYLEFYAAYGDTSYPMTIEVRQLSGYGWNLIDIVDGSIPTGYTAHTLSTSNAFAINEDSKTFTVTKSGNVGIGTTSPIKKLDVVGDINATGYVYGLTGLCIGTDCRTSWQVSAISPWDNSTTWTFIREGYPLNVNVSNILFVNSTSGNVGIGISNPGHTLDVQGSLRLRNLSTPSAVNGTIYFDTTLKRFRCYQGAWTDCITTFTEPATGLWNLTGSLIYPKDLTWNLGIGTATPTEKLEVQGRLLVASSNPFELEPSDNILDVKGSINATGTIYGTLANNIVTTASISDGAVTTSKIADSAVTTAKIADGAITNSKIALNAINTSQIIDLTIQTSDIADSSITSAKIADGTIVDVDISTTAAINPSKITSGTFGGTGNYVFPANIKINGNNILDSSGATRITLGATTAIAGTTNLNIAGGYLQIGGINVIDPSRNIINVNWVNATNFNASNSIRASSFLIGNTQVIDSSRNLVNINRLDIGTINVIDPSRNIININWVNATNLNLTSNAYIGNSLFFVPDVQLFRGAANRLDLASGNSLNLISGNLQIGGINVITSGRLIQAANGSASSPAYSFISDTDTGIYRASENTLNFVTAGLDRLTIDSAGRVGINTAIPTEQLEVQGRLLVASSNPFELEPSDNILDVKGSINATIAFYVPKNSTQPFVCDSTKESAIFFNTTDKKFYGCTGTAWVIIGTQA